MRKTLLALPLAAAMTLPGAAFAQSLDREPVMHPAVPLVGVAVGTAVGVGLYEGWYGSGAFASSLPASAGGAATTGLVAGIGTIALIDAATQPCKGFRALFSPFIAGPSGCVNGQYVGYRTAERNDPRVYRR